MPFDGNPPTEVTVRDNVLRLRNFLAGLNPKQFYYWAWSEERRCGTVACVAGWQGVLMNDPAPPFERVKHQPNHIAWRERMASSLGLAGAGDTLFMNAVYDGDTLAIAQVVIVLDHYLETGKIDWTVAKAAA